MQPHASIGAACSCCARCLRTVHCGNTHLISVGSPCRILPGKQSGGNSQHCATLKAAEGRAWRRCESLRVRSRAAPARSGRWRQRTHWRPPATCAPAAAGWRCRPGARPLTPPACPDMPRMRGCCAHNTHKVCSVMQYLHQPYTPGQCALLVDTGAPSQTTGRGLRVATSNHSNCVEIQVAHAEQPCTSARPAWRHKQGACRATLHRTMPCIAS